MDDKRLSNRLKLYHCLWCSATFGIIYHYTAVYAKSLGSSIHRFTFFFEKDMPFWEWMIIPYMTSGVFFVAVFLWCRRREELFMLTKMLLMATIIAGLCFIIFPLRFSWDKPIVENTLLHPFFQFLEHYDTPFNQAPSLHITYAFIFARIVYYRFMGIIRVVLLLWIFLMGISTLLVYQHHFIDVILGSMLGWGVIRYFRPSYE